MTSILLLWLLATLDAAMSGYRAAGGRNALIRKRGYQIHAQLFGVIIGQCCLAAIAGIVIALLLTAENRDGLADDLIAACWRLHSVFIPYSLLFVTALVLRSIPSVDFRSILNVLVFGPFTLLRPFVGVGGVVWAFICVPRWQVLGLGLTGVSVMLALEFGLNRRFAKRSPEPS